MKNQRSELSDVDKAMLVLEDTPFKYAGAKETRIREDFDISPTLFWQRIDYLITRPEALEWNAQLVRRLQRLRTKRQAQRSARVRGVDLS